MDMTSEKLALAKAQIKDIEAVKKSLQTKFNIADDVPFSDYPSLISGNGVPEPETKFYKCASTYHDPYIPAHINLQFSGITSPAEANTLFVNARPDLSGNIRKWTADNGNYHVSFDESSKCWIMYANGSSNTTRYYSLFYAPTYETAETGNSSNPYLWDNVASADRSITQGFSLSYDSPYIYLYLEAGTAYKFGIVSTLEGTFYIYSLSLYSAGNTDNVLVSGSSSNTGDINTHSCTHVFSYTPTQSGVYRINAYGDDYGVTGGDLKIVCYPAPGANPAAPENPSDAVWTRNTSGSYGGTGDIVCEAAQVEAHQATKTWTGYEAFKKTADDGSLYYDFASSETTGLTWERVAPNNGEVWSSDGLVKAGYFTESYSYPKNSTVVLIDIPADNTTIYSGVRAAGMGNIIDWGDGSQTEVLVMKDSVGGSKYTVANNSLYSHTYAKAGRYIMQFVGDSLRQIRPISNSGGEISINNSYTRELIQLGNSLTSMLYMFTLDKGLERIADTCQIPSGVTEMHNAFASSGLIYAPASLRLPQATMREAFYGCGNMIADVTHWWDNYTIGGNGGYQFGLYKTFQDCKKIYGTLPADKLWKDGSWSDSSGMGSSNYVFLNCTNLTNYNDIPKSWKQG